MNHLQTQNHYRQKVANDIKTLSQMMTHSFNKQMIYLSFNKIESVCYKIIMMSPVCSYCHHRIRVKCNFMERQKLFRCQQHRLRCMNLSHHLRLVSRNQMSLVSTHCSSIVQRQGLELNLFKSSVVIIQSLMTLKLTCPQMKGHTKIHYLPLQNHSSLLISPKNPQPK